MGTVLEFQPSFAGELRLESASFGSCGSFEELLALFEETLHECVAEWENSFVDQRSEAARNAAQSDATFYISRRPLQEIVLESLLPDSSNCKSSQVKISEWLLSAQDG